MEPKFKQAGSGLDAASLQEALEAAQNASAKGLSQFLTPRDLARTLSMPLPKWRPTILDLNCGRGDLLFAAANKTTENLFGIDIDARQSAKSESDKIGLERIVGDTTKVYPLLAEVRCQFDLICLNPPWDLHFYKERLEGLLESDLLTVRSAFTNGVDQRLGKNLIDSTIAMYFVALDRLTHRGEGYLIANNATLDRLLFGPDAPYKDAAVHTWARIIIKGNPMTGIDDHQWGDEFETAVIYFATGHLGGPKFKERVENMEQLQKVMEQLTNESWRYRCGPRIETEYQNCKDTSTLFHAVREEWGVRNKTRKGNYNIWLDEHGMIQTYLSVFEDRSIKVSKEEAKRLFKLRGQRPMQLVMQAEQRAELKRAVSGTLWKVHPDLPRLVEECVVAYHAVRAPLYPLSPIQCLGYLDEENSIVCQKDLAIGAGEISPLFRKYAEEFIATPNRTTWDALHTVCVTPNGKTAWAMVCKMEPDFQKEIDYWHEQEYKETKDLAHKWDRVPKISTIKGLLVFKPIFLAGNLYDIKTKAVRVERSKKRPSLSFGDEEFLMNGMELAIWVKDENGVQRLFMEKKHAAEGVKVADESESLQIDFYLEDLISNFKIPKVPDVAECNPEKFDEKLKQLEVLEEMLNA